MTDTYCEPWDNDACLGYVISALENLGYTPDQITLVVMELREIFDWLTVDDAERLFSGSDYH